MAGCLLLPLLLERALVQPINLLYKGSIAFKPAQLEWLLRVGGKRKHVKRKPVAWCCRYVPESEIIFFVCVIDLSYFGVFFNVLIIFMLSSYLGMFSHERLCLQL